MGLLNVSLLIGQSGLLTQRAALDIIGNNIANANTPGYVRQRPELVDGYSVPIDGGLYSGSGVRLGRVDRVMDIYLEQSLRQANSSFSYFEALKSAFSRMEAIVNEFTDMDISSTMNQFFNSLQDLQQNVEDVSLRTVVIENAKKLAMTFQSIMSKFSDYRTSINNQVAVSVDSINDIIQKVADLNVKIVEGEKGGAYPESMAALRNQRDNLLQELSSMINVKVYEQADGSVNVLSGSNQLVVGGLYYGLETQIRLDGGEQVYDVVFKADGRSFVPADGELKGLLEFRDTLLKDTMDDFDELASTFINEFNRIYAQGSGLSHFSTITGLVKVQDPAAALNTAGLAFMPTNGSFNINVVDTNTGEVRTFNIDVDLDGIGADTSLNDIVAEITTEITSQISAIQASLTTDGRLSLSSSSGDYEFYFSDDTSGILASLGVNTFFTGSTAATMGVSSLVENDPSLFAASANGLPGDNSNLLALCELKDASVGALGDRSFDQFYNTIVSDIATNSKSAQTLSASASSYLDSLNAQKDSISGVDLDEQGVDLVRYQNAFQASARFISTINDLLDVLLNMA